MDTTPVILFPLFLEYEEVCRTNYHADFTS